MTTASGRQFIEAKCSSVLVTPLSTAFNILLAQISMERGVSTFLSRVILMPVTLEFRNPTEQIRPKGKHKEITERLEITVNPDLIFCCTFEAFFFFFN